MNLPSRRRFLRHSRDLAVGATLPSRWAGAVALLASPVVDAVQAGERAPAFGLPGPAGATVNLEALRGRVVLVDFWASWCAPCKLSFPWLGELQARLGPRGLQVVAVNLDREARAAEAFLRALEPQMRAPLLVAFDPAGDTPRRYGVKAMPTSVLIGADGVVRLHHGGFREDDKPMLESAVLSALARAGR